MSPMSLHRPRIAALLVGVLVISLAAPAAVAAQTSPGAALLDQAGWRAHEAGDHEAALAAFRAALATDAGIARLHLGAALAAYALGRDAEARTSVDRALALDATLPLARELLGRLLHR